MQSATDRPGGAHEPAGLRETGETGQPENALEQKSESSTAMRHLPAIIKARRQLVETSSAAPTGVLK